MQDKKCEGCDVCKRVFTFVETGCDQIVWFDDKGSSFMVEMGYRTIGDDEVINTFACSVCTPWEMEFEVPDCIHVFAERIRRGTLEFVEVRAKGRAPSAEAPAIADECSESF